MPYFPKVEEMLPRTPGRYLYDEFEIIFVFSFTAINHVVVGFQDRCGIEGAAFVDRSGDLYDVPQNGASRRQRTCALSVKHEIVHRVALDKESVEFIAYGRQRMFERYQGRLYVTLHCAFCFFAVASSLIL